MRLTKYVTITLLSTVLVISACGKKNTEIPRVAICTESGAVQSTSVGTFEIMGTVDGESNPVHASGSGGEVVRIGSGRLPAWLERALLCKKPGETVDVTLQPKDAYGEATRSTELVRAAFGPDAEKLKEGREYEIGPGLRAKVTSIDGERITAEVPNDHPLGGKTIHYHVLVKDVRNR